MYTVNRTVSIDNKRVIEDLPILENLIFPDLETAKNALYHFLMSDKSFPLSIMMQTICDMSKKSEIVNNFLNTMNNYKVGVGGHLNRFTFHVSYIDRITQDKEVTYIDTFFIQELQLVPSIKDQL